MNPTANSASTPSSVAMSGDSGAAHHDLVEGSAGPRVRHEVRHCGTEHEATGHGHRQGVERAEAVSESLALDQRSEQHAGAGSHQCKQHDGGQGRRPATPVHTEGQRAND